MLLHVPGGAGTKEGGAVTAEPMRTTNQTRLRDSLGNAERAGHRPSAVHPDSLTGREEEVLQLLIQGVTTTHGLAASLVVTDNTVKFSPPQHPR